MRKLRSILSRDLAVLNSSRGKSEDFIQDSENDDSALKKIIVYAKKLISSSEEAEITLWGSKKASSVLI